MKKNIIIILSLFLIFSFSSCGVSGTKKVETNKTEIKQETKKQDINNKKISKNNVESTNKQNVEPTINQASVKNNNNQKSDTIFVLTHDGKFLQDICVENHGDAENTKKLVEKMKNDILDDEMSLMPYEATKVETKFVDSCSEKYDYYCEIVEKSLSFGLESDSSGVKDANVEVNDSGFKYKIHFAAIGYKTDDGKMLIMLTCKGGGGKLFGPNGEVKTKNDWK